MPWFKRKKKQEQKKDQDTSVAASKPRLIDPDIQPLLHKAREILQQKKYVEALEFLGNSSKSDSEPVLRMMHAIAYKHQDNLRNKNASFLDPIFCQCSVCDSVWIIPPGYWCDQPGEYASPITGLECYSCGRVFCPECAKGIQGNCQCGGTFSFLCRPNGRKPKPEALVKDKRDWGIGLPRSPETPVRSDLDLHLYYGYEGKVLAGIDLSFPLVQTHSAETHLIWAETLLDAGVFYQAQKQLDLLNEEDNSNAQALWLRSRLEFVKFQNAKIRVEKRLGRLLGWRSVTTHLDYILKWLNDAIIKEPNFGFAWLMLAQTYRYVAIYHYDNTSTDDLNQAHRCALRAQELLGSTPPVLLGLGEILYQLEQYSESLTILRQVPVDSEEHDQAKKTLELSKLKVRAQSEVTDIEALWQLGRRYLRHNQYNKAREIFTKLYDQHPERPEGYYGLAEIKRFTQTGSSAFNESYQLCQKAISLNINFGPVYELLGNIFETIYNNKVDFPIEDPIPYYQRAVDLDSTCDFALWRLAEKYTDEGKLEPALDALEQAAALDTNISTVFFMLEVIYGGLRQFDKAVWAFNKAKEKSPNTALTEEKKWEIRKNFKFEY